MFKFRLALALGMTLYELEQRMTAQEFNKWQHYYQVERFGYVQDQLDMAQLRATVMNFSGNIKKPISPLDLMPDRFQKEVPQDDEAQVISWLES